MVLTINIEKGLWYKLTQTKQQKIDGVLAVDIGSGTQ